MVEYSTYTGTVGSHGSAEYTLKDGIGSGSSASTGTEFNGNSGFETPGDIMSTAKNASGSPVVGRTVRASDTIEVHGQRMTLAMAQNLGSVSRDISGAFTATEAGTAGASHDGAKKNGTALASGGTAEEALESGFQGTQEAEEILSGLVSRVSGDTQIAALDSFLRNGGELDDKVLSRLASQASIEPDQMAALVASVHDGMETAVYDRIAPLGVYDRDAFAAFLHGSPETQERLMTSVRDLMMHNSVKGIETLASEFAEQADTADPDSVDAALEEAGIPFKRTGGGVILDLTASGMGQMPFRQAVRLGVIKLSRNR